MTSSQTPVPASGTSAAFDRLARVFVRHWPGIGLSSFLALTAILLSAQYGGPSFLYALAAGVVFHHLASEPRSRPGIDLCASSLLRLGVGLLGARIAWAQIAALGWTTAAVVVLAVTTTIAFALAGGRMLGMTRAQSVLCGGAVAICGASAALAISAVLPRDRDSQRHTLSVVVTVTALSTAAMLFYPAVARLLELSPRLAGLFLGGTIHDVAQVVGAGYTLGPAAGDVATVVKLFRVAMLTLVVMAVSVAFRNAHAIGDGHDSEVQGRPPLLPWFLWVFIALVLANSAGALSDSIRGACDEVSRLGLTVAIAALGLKTSIKDIAATGWRTLVLLCAETAWIGLLVLLCALMMR